MLAIFILILTFTRFYRLEEFLTFLGDQGRDAIIIKRIITLEHLPAIGPVSSIGQVFLGPFYYYLMSPFLFLFKFNPVGLGFGVGFLSIVSLIIFFFLLRKIDKTLAHIFLFLATFSSILVYSSRFSWNPNLLPYFAFFTLYFFSHFILTKKRLFVFLTGVFFALSTQLHYLGLLLIFPLFISTIFNLKKILKERSFKNLLIDLFSFIGGLFLFNLPLVFFDIKNKFLNSKNFIKAFTQVKETYGGSFLNRFWETMTNFFNYVFNIQLSHFLIALILFFFLIVFFFFPKKLKNHPFIQINWLNFFSFIFIFSSLNSFRFWHYYQTIYLSFFLILSVILSFLFRKNFLNKIFVFLFLIYFFFLQYKKYPFYQKQGNFQTKIAKKIAQSIIKENPKPPYQIVPIPFTEMDGHIRYYLEIYGKKPLSEESSIEGNELYVLCYEKNCDVLNHPQWQIAAFSNKKIKKIWLVDRVKIYKIVHGK